MSSGRFDRIFFLDPKHRSTEIQENLPRQADSTDEKIGTVIKARRLQ
jgi:hypothetical protein